MLLSFSSGQIGIHSNLGSDDYVLQTSTDKLVFAVLI